MKTSATSTIHRLSSIFLIFIFTGFFPAFAQKYSGARAHSHNDYLQQKPFFLAFEHGFGSIETDLFYRNDSLFVAHERNEITAERTFEALYLDPIVQICKQNGGLPYADSTRYLQLLVDLKTPYKETLGLLVKKLAPYRDILFPAGKVRVVISGNTPPPDSFSSYPEYIFFDGRPEIIYQPDALAKLGLISQTFRKYSRWDGSGKISDKDLVRLQKVVAESHQKGKPFRFWASPDTENTWKLLLQIKADFLNTDKIAELSEFLKNPGN